MVVDSPFITTFQTPQDNWFISLEELEDNNMLMASVQTGEINMVISYIQIRGNNMSRPYGQGINISSIGPDLELKVISYGNNQPTNLNLCFFNSSSKDVSLELKPIILTIWQLLKSVYGSR